MGETNTASEENIYQQITYHISEKQQSPKIREQKEYQVSLHIGPSQKQKHFIVNATLNRKEKKQLKAHIYSDLVHFPRKE